MKKSIMYQIVSGMMWACICRITNFHILSWEFWVIILLGNILTTVLYDICKN